MTIGLQTSVNDRPHRVTFQNPGPRVPDGEGGYTQSWLDLNPPAMNMRIETATAQRLEQLAAGSTTLIAKATHLITGPFHPQVTTKTRVQFTGRTFAVLGVSDPDQ